VKTGRLIGDRLEVLAGLAGGEKVVVSGIDKAVSGSRVEN
jgi:multidrug efflux pump subunit AcrA (membrane-fusion protein)